MPIVLGIPVLLIGAFASFRTWRALKDLPPPSGWYFRLFASLIVYVTVTLPLIFLLDLLTR